MDRPFEQPAPTFDGRVEDQLVTLVPRAGDAEIRELVASLFQAVSREASDQLRLLFTDESTASFPGAENQTAHVSWLRRFNKGSYGALSSHLMYRDDAIEIYRATDLAVLRAREHLFFVPDTDDLVVVVPLVSPTVGGERLFGTELQLLVSSESSGLKIRASYEDYVLQ